MQNREKQRIQDKAYSFPYHYIPDTSNGFTQARCLNWGYEYMAYLGYVVKKIKEKEFESMLDIGCGDGRLVFELNRIFKNKKIEGTDNSEKALNFARAFNPENKFWKNIDQIDTQYDLVTLIEVIEHIPSNQVSGFVFNVTNLLKKNGCLIVTVPSDRESVKPKHYQNFNKRMLENLLITNYEIEEVAFINNIRSSVRIKLLKSILANNYFILNNSRLLRFFYNYYCNNLLITSENNARRICLIAKKR